MHLLKHIGENVKTKEYLNCYIDYLNKRKVLAIDSIKDEDIYSDKFKEMFKDFEEYMMYKFQVLDSKQIKKIKKNQINPKDIKAEDTDENKKISIKNLIHNYKIDSKYRRYKKK